MMNEPLLEPKATSPNCCCAQQSSNPMTMPMTAPMAEMMRPSNRKMRTICLSEAPKLRRVTTSSFLSMISIESEPMMLKQATIRMNVRKM